MKATTSERLIQLLDVDDNLTNLKRVYHAHKGEWIPERQHTKLDPGAMSSSCSLLSYYSTELKYHYLTKFPTLFYLETYRLNLQYRGLPLSLADAYSLLLNKSNDLKNYRLFQMLLRQGYVGLERQSLSSHIEAGSNSAAIDRLDQVLKGGSDKDCNKPLRKLKNDESVADVLAQLSQYGPKCDEPTDSESQVRVDDKSSYLFDVYRKKSFNNSRPYKNPHGKPDTTLAVINMDDVGCLRVSYVLNDNLVFALFDNQEEFCFAKFEPVPSKELNRLQF